MQRFILFGGECYYASGGMHDYAGDFATIEEAESRAKELDRLHERSNEWEWWHIFDCEAGQVASHGEWHPYGSSACMPKLEPFSSYRMKNLTQPGAEMGGGA